jgi:hypothetical protein
VVSNTSPLPLPAPQNANAAAPQPEAPRASLPSFVDPGRGGIKDIPAYPGGQVTNVMHGPQDGFNTMRITMQTRDSVDKVVEFYEKAARSNGWTILSKDNNGEVAAIDFKKGEKDNGGVRVQRDAQTNVVTIFIARAESLGAAKQ